MGIEGRRTRPLIVRACNRGHEFHQRDLRRSHGRSESIASLSASAKVAKHIASTRCSSDASAEDFVLGENQEQHADGDAQSNQRPGIRIPTVRVRN
jgi:hypothetical protein